MDVTTTAALLTLASSQDGLFTTRQALACGLDKDELRRWKQHGRIEPVHRAVWAVVGAARSSEREARAVLLAHGDGAALCRSSAACCWGVPGHRLIPAQVIRRRDEHHPSVGSTRTSRAITADDVTIRRGLTVTTPLRTIFDLAGVQHPARTRRDLNDLMGRGLLTLDLLDEGLRRLAKKGRAGTTTMRQLIAEAHEVGVPAGSNLELTVEELLRLAGLGAMRRQLEIWDDDGLVARVDFGQESLRVVVEVDSDRFHHGLVDRQLDARKTARLEALGWVVLRISEREVWHERTALLDRLRRTAWRIRSARAA